MNLTGGGLVSEVDCQLPPARYRLRSPTGEIRTHESNISARENTELKFSLLSLMWAVLVAALTIASMRGGHHYWHAVLRIALLFSFLTAVVFTVYSKSETASFAGGWAICVGVTLVLVFCNVPLIATSVEHAVRRANPRSEFQGYSLDLAFSAIAAYYGGSLAFSLRRNKRSDRTSVSS